MQFLIWGLGFISCLQFFISFGIYPYTFIPYTLQMKKRHLNCRFSDEWENDFKYNCWGNDSNELP